ncbi:hypothetical protein BDD12DRAFT_879666 [Trichophaea hybrida]|nr:hypothetical protein BDD12DRAFT_879666 [Trichophaea hybrida]
MRQCLLAMKDARDNKGGGEVYGFVTTGGKLANDQIRWDISDDREDGGIIRYNEGRQREMDEGLLRLGGLHVRSVEQWRHCEEMIEGNTTTITGVYLFGNRN